MVTKKRISSKILDKGNDTSTAQRAGLTAALQYTRGKELVEHAPGSLIPDPNNPRPGEIIDDGWFKKILKLGTPESLCFASEGGWVIPKFESLSGDLGGAKKEDYEFLVQLSKSIRLDGLIEPIEIFLADKQHEPDYFIGREESHGYVVLEGHQRRLAAMIGGIPTVTCIKITDDTLLAKLKVKHRKLRRQLSENNLRKNVTAGQHYQIVRQLFSTLEDDEDLTADQLQEITGLNFKSSQVLKRIVCAEEGVYPNILYQKLLSGELSMRALRDIVSKTFDEINTILSGNSAATVQGERKVKPVARGKAGGRVKKSATFKISSQSDSDILKDYLKRAIPELKIDEQEESSFKQLESILKQLLDNAKAGKG